MNKLISITMLLGLCLTMPAQAVPMSQKLATSGIVTESGEQDTTATQVRSVSPGMRNLESMLVTQAMTPPVIDNFVTQESGPIAEFIQDATSSMDGIGLDVDLTALPDDLVDFSDAGELGIDTDRIVTSEPATLLLWLAGFLALLARRR